MTNEEKTEKLDRALRDYYFRKRQWESEKPHWWQLAAKRKWTTEEPSIYKGSEKIATTFTLIRQVRERARGLSPDLRGLILELARRFELVMESPDVCTEAREEVQILSAEQRNIVHILGSVWTIKERSESEDERLKDCDGYCDWTTREIVVEREELGILQDMERYIRNVKRHEIVHAFLFESGLSHCSCSVESWARNEEMVDWIANQGPKIYEAWKEAGAVREDE